jgi:hypothetical protein
VKTYDWEKNTYRCRPLTPYLVGLRRDYVYSLGFQDFPAFSAGEFSGQDGIISLNARDIREEAELLGMRRIWFNTGTPYSINTTDEAGKDARILVGSALRKKILDDALKVAKTLRSQNYEVTINIFAVNTTAQGIDWSYNQNDGHRAVFKTFVDKINSSGIGLSLFDPS